MVDLQIMIRYSDKSIFEATYNDHVSQKHEYMSSIIC